MIKSIGKTILLVEDEAIIAMNEKKQLEKYGYVVKTVANGKKAIEAVATSSDIDLILMDINLGDDIDGTEAAEIILKDHDIPIVFVSSHTEPEIVEKTEKITSYGYVVKNSSVTVLDASIKMAFKLFLAKKMETEKEKALMLSEEKYRLISENTSDGIVHFSAEGLIDYVSPAYLKQLGYPEFEEYGKGYDTIIAEIHPDDRDSLFSAIHGAIGKKERELTYTYRVRRADGHYIWREDHSRFMYDPSGAYLGAYVSCRDITDRKIMEATLVESEGRFKKILQDHSTLAVQGYGIDGTTNYWNKASERLYGYTAQEAIGRNLLDLIIPEEMKNEVAQAIKKMVETGKNIPESELSLVRKDGSRVHVFSTHALVQSSSHLPELFCLDIDITGRIKSEKALRESEAQKNAILQGLSANVALLDSDLKIIWVNKAAANSVNTQIENLVGKHCYEFWGDTVRSCKDCPSVKAIQSGKSENQIRKTKDGIFWDIKGEPIFDESGEIVAIVEIAQDITLLKTQEESLRNSAKRLEGIIEGTHVGTWEWNVQTGETIFNSIWAEMIGYTLEELAPISIQTWGKFAHPDDLKKSEELLSQHFSGQTPFYESECRLRHKDGHWVWVLDKGKVITWTEDGKPSMMFGTHTDISEQRKASDKILSLFAEKELILKEVHHRIKNNMNTISSLLSLQAQAVKEPSATIALKDARNRVHGMSLLYDKLYRSSDYTELSIKEYLSSLVDEVVANFPNSPIVRIKKDFQDFKLDAKRLQTLGIIINELLTNIMKYAFTGKDSGHIVVSAISNNNHVRIVVQDDGNGIPESISFENSTGFGLQLVHALVQQLDGTIQLERGKRTKVILEFME